MITTEIKPVNFAKNFSLYAIKHIEKLAEEYGLYGKVINYKANSLDSRAGMYVVVSMIPISEKVNPIKIIERNKRNEDLFYPINFAVKIHHPIKTLNEIVEYCRNAEFVATIFSEYHKDIPEKIRKDELYPLMEFNEGIHHPNYDEALQRLYKRQLVNYFDGANPTNGFDRKWKDFYRSEKFNPDDSYFKKLLVYKNRGEQNVDLDILFKGTSTIKKITLPEHEYKQFVKNLKSCYPDVLYHADEKWVIDHGMMKDENSPFGKTITHEKYCELVEKYFASMQFDSIKKVKPSYFEYREIYYRESDEAIIAGICNDIRLRYAKVEPIETLKENGEIKIVALPQEDFMNFVSLAKYNKIPFSLDIVGNYSKPSFDYVNIVFNTYNEERINTVINRIMLDKIKNQHAINPEQLNHRETSLLRKIQSAETKQNNVYTGFMDTQENNKCL